MLSQKVQELKPSATLALSTFAKELKAQGKDVLNLCTGEPTWDFFNSTKEAMIQAIHQGSSGYSPASGRPELKKAIIQDIRHHFGLDYQSNQVTVSIGAKYILFSALQTLIDPEDEVLIPAPYWLSYPAMVDLVGGQKTIVETCQKTHKLDRKVLEKSITSKTKVLILNSPNNPTGAVYSMEELKELGQCLAEHPNIYVFSDDIYNRMALDLDPLKTAPHILQACPQIQDRVLIINAASKNYAMPGWRVGWAVGPSKIIQSMSNFQSQTVSCSPTAAQIAMTSTFQNCEDDIQRVHQILKQKRDRVVQALRNVPGLQFEIPSGAFYVWADVGRFIGRKYKNKIIRNSSDFCNFLSENQFMFLVPGEEFGRSGFFRMYFGVEDEQLQQAGHRLNLFISKLS